MGQDGQTFKYMFDNKNNLLTSSPDETFISTMDYPYFFTALLSTSDIITSVDFTTGTQPFQYNKSAAHNAMIKARKNYLYTNPANIYNIYIKALEKYRMGISNFYELISCASLFDGAAIYGLPPIYDINELILNINFQYEYKMQIITKTTNMIQSKLKMTVQLNKKLPKTFYPILKLMKTLDLMEQPTLIKCLEAYN